MIHRFEPEAWYEEAGLRARGLDGQALARAVRRGELRCRKVGRTRLFKGSWLTEWLQMPETKGAADER